MTLFAHDDMFRGTRPVLAIVALLAITLALTGAPRVAAQETDRVQLGVKPVGIDGSYFALTMSPGEARQLTVELGNFGTRDAIALTYPADVYSLVNGGMGVRLAGEPASGTTTWLGYQDETLPLIAGQATLRTFAVSVPEDAAPGEYITSIVVQDATPAGESAGGVVANRVNRQAIAVAITVPGPAAPGLALGAVTHRVSGGRSVITVEVENSGNVRLRPGGELVLTTPSGGEPERFPITMESVYAGTRTVAEVAFTSLLAPGDYVARFSLSDADHSVSAVTGTVSLTISETTLPVSAPVPSQATPLTTDQQQSSVGGRTPLLLASLAIGVVALGLCWFTVSRRRTPRRAQQTVSSPTSATSQPVTAVATRPATIRQLEVPRRSQPPQPERPPGGAAHFKSLGIHRA